MNKYIYIILCLLILGCSLTPLDKAFKGEFASGENNKIIDEYCHSCHIHKDYYPDSHVMSVSKKYEDARYRKARECRICHFIVKNFYGDIERRTRWPNQVKAGLYKNE